MKKLKICLDAGHGGSKRGSSFNGIDEADVNLTVALHLEKLLIRMGHEVIMTRSIDIITDLAERVAIAKRGKADIVISIHCNADLDDDSPGKPEAQGAEIFIYKGSIKGHRLANALAQGVSCIFPDHKFRGIKESTSLYMLRNPPMPAVLLELLFMDNIVENARLANPAFYGYMAQLISKGVEEYVGL